MKKLTHKEYIKALKDSGIKLTPLDTYVTRDSRLRFRCPKGHISIMRAGMLLRKEVSNGCRECRYTEKRKTLPAYKADLKKVHGAKIKVIGKVYTNAMTKITHSCTRCNHTWDVTPNDLLSRKNPCKFCDGDHLTETKVLKRFNSVEHVSLENYNGGSSVTVKCVDCNHIWDSTLNNITKKLSGCPICVRDGTNLYAKKEVKIRRRTLLLQGYEEQAVRWLMRNRKIKLSDLAFTPAEGKPTVRYSLDKRDRTYFPDFYHKPTNTIVEVKSKYTLGINKGSSRNVLKLVKAKARACIELGYNFKLMLMDATGSLIPLPEDWLSMDKRKINRYITGNKK